MPEIGCSVRQATTRPVWAHGPAATIREADRPDPWREQAQAEAGATSLHLAPGLTVASGPLLMMLAPGDAMSPTIPAASPMIIERGARPERDGPGVYVLRFGEFTAVRRVARALTERGAWRLMSDNAAYREEQISDADMAETACLGRVVFLAAR